MGRSFEVRKASMAKTAGQKSKLYSKYGKQLYVMAKNGGADPTANPSLRSLIEKAKRDQVPSHVIEKALEKANGAGGETFVLARYEGFGPGGCSIIIDCLTDKAKNAFHEAFPDVELAVEEISFVPQTNTDISSDDLPMFEKFINMLNDCDDVQDIYHNAILPK